MIANKFLGIPADNRHLAAADTQTRSTCSPNRRAITIRIIDNQLPGVGAVVRLPVNVKLMLKYTQRVTEFAGVDSLSVSFGHKIYKTCRNPYNNKPLLLLPSAILSPLPIADTFDDIDWICQENERVREEINSYFDLGKKTKLHKSQILTLMRNSTSFRTALIAAYKATPKRVYDFSEDPAGEYVWLSAAREYTEKYPLSLSQVPLETSDDVLTIAKTICNQFKTLVRLRPSLRRGACRTKLI